MKHITSSIGLRGKAGYGINNSFEGNCCIMPLVTIELGNPLGDTSTVLAVISFLKWSARAASISAARKLISIGTETSPSWLKSHLKPHEKMNYPEPSQRGL